MRKLWDVHVAQGYQTSTGWCLYPWEGRFRFIALLVNALGPFAVRPWPLVFNGSETTIPTLSSDSGSSNWKPWGARRREAARLESFGAECWMEDPEGQPFLTLVLKQGSIGS
jgi:hypothetical protein